MKTHLSTKKSLPLNFQKKKKKVFYENSLVVYKKVSLSTFKKEEKNFYEKLTCLQKKSQLSKKFLWKWAALGCLYYYLHISNSNS